MTAGTPSHNLADPKRRQALAREFCPRCHGIMMLDFDFRAGYYRTCINCGHIKYLHRPALTQNRGSKLDSGDTHRYQGLVHVIPQK